ncbi:transketolase [Candidatus Curtissbacteria bacterium RBG_16_39_7]|uniref:Transketolase n=1 Tax=Candidatus Curtissbacteria bacterium RBG_16_39_7 TaxID=1797707 RepID=A0A1F5G430_9BACT|nr:MAG: transketolase [Candidatus Curtissbacteria bacterium RBG_16_39_7]
MSDIKLNPKIFDQDVEQVATRDGYGQGLVELGKANPNIVVLTGDLSDSTRAAMFQKEFPDRFIECGIAEQNMIGIATGLALTGKVPFVSSYAVFTPGRCWDQIRVSVCYSKANVKIAGAHAGVSVGPDGATHQGLEDIASLRVIPNLIVIVPCDVIETKKCTITAGEIVGPVYFRFAREKTPVITTQGSPFKVGKAEIFLDLGDDVAICASGPLLYQSLIAAKELEKEGIKAVVVNSHTIKPMDVETLVDVAKRTKAMVTVEDHQTMGGCGSAVAEVLAQHCPVPIEFVGMPNVFGESGAPEELLEKYGMSVKSIKSAVKKVTQRK